LAVGAEIVEVAVVVMVAVVLENGESKQTTPPNNNNNPPNKKFTHKNSKVAVVSIVWSRFTQV
jgi:hypothetical protein